MLQECQPPRQLTRFHAISLTAILFIAAAVRLVALGRAPLWVDEQAQLHVARSENVAEYIRRSGDLGPIGRLSYLDSAVVWRLGARSRALFRVPAALWGIATVWLLFELGRRWFNPLSGLFASALLAVHGLHIQFSREARGYALLVFLTVLWALLLTRMLRRVQWSGSILFFAISWIALEVHPVFFAPMSAMLVAAIAATLLDWRTRRGGDSTPGNPFKKGWSAGILPANGGTPPSVFHRADGSPLLAILLIGLPGLAALSMLALRRDMPIVYSNLTQHRESLSYYILDTYKALIGGYWGFPSYVFAGVMGFGLVAGLRDSRFRFVTLLTFCVMLAAPAPVVVGYLKGMWVVPRYSLFAVPFIVLAGGFGIQQLLQRLQVKPLLVQLSAPLLALALLAGMWLQGRSPYDLEHQKKTDSQWETLENRGW